VAFLIIGILSVSFLPKMMWKMKYKRKALTHLRKNATAE